MKATEANLLKFIRKSPQFLIPIYQRNYSWTADQCRQLWADLLRSGKDDRINAHFIGSIVYVERALSAVTNQEGLLVIDGQQRLTTTSLLIAALAHHFEKYDVEELLDTFSARKLRNYYLLNPDESGDRHYKLILSETDKTTLLALLKGITLPDDASKRITENYQLFRELIAAEHTSLEAVCKGLAKLVVVEVALDRSQDNPQLIFESMNSTGLELSQADLIRNYILMGLEPALQTELYVNYWRPMERAFGQDGYPTHFDAFMRHYLTTKTGDIPNVRDVYTAFKRYARDSQKSMQELVSDTHAFSKYYAAMALGAESNPELRQAFHDLREFKVDVAYPFLLEAYDDYTQKLLSSDEFLMLLRTVESYVFRRAICAMPPNSLNKTFAALGKSIDKSNYLESFQAAFLLLPSYRRFPNDEEFERELKQRDLYSFPRRSYWLRRFENNNRKERVVIEEYTIEHIMPQNEMLSAQWRDELGDDWRRVHQTLLHTLGNLTLTAYNSEYKDYSFAYKRDKATDKLGNLIGFAQSPLKLNQGLGQVVVWNEGAIIERANRLAKEACNVWPIPDLDGVTLQKYAPKPQTKAGTIYGIEDHPHLSSGIPQEIFEILRKELLALDPCVAEECLKHYIAFKAETNFVDVIPQARRLKLMLNMPFHDIEDPKSLCIDVTNLGRRGNGDVEVTISDIDQLPYVLGLVRQSFERQMGQSESN